MSYSDKVIDHYNNPRNVGSMDKSSGLVGAPECGDVMKLQIKVNRDTNVIEEAKFKTFGCGSAIASSSLATEWVKGKTVDEALTIKNMDIVKELSLPPVKIHCSVLAEDAIRAAISDWKKKQESARGGMRKPGTEVPGRVGNAERVPAGTALTAMSLRGRVRNPLGNNDNCNRTNRANIAHRAGQGHPSHRASPGQGARRYGEGRYFARAGRVAPGRAGRRMLRAEL